MFSGRCSTLKALKESLEDWGWLPADLLFVLPF
jgi:hypothetical protein